MSSRYMYFVQDFPADASPWGRDSTSRHDEIAEAAYFLSEARGFVPGHELDDWVAAEREIDARLSDDAHRRFASV